MVLLFCAETRILYINCILTPDSVDLLLQEIKELGLHEASNVLDPSLVTASPTKPLSFPAHKTREKDRDCNSSSDTYVSDTGAPDGEQPHQISFERNFEASEGDSGAWDENNENHDSAHNTAPVATSEPALPSKSIMRLLGTPGTSPKKSVAFPPEKNLETLHCYSPSAEHESLPVEDAKAPLLRSWAEINSESLADTSSASLPPVPPPHTSSTITGLLSSDGPAEGYDDADMSEIQKYRMRDHSNLLLNEKLDIYLNNSHGHDDLDGHLDQLQRAKGEETAVNIHHLSYQMELHDHVENPLNVLYKTQEVNLRSAGSSQSSLQSLVELNRYLESATVDTVSRGIQLNDGIQGFPDQMARLMIPRTDVDDDDSSDMLTFGLRGENNGLENDDNGINTGHVLRSVRNTSFDQSYNLTEKSIMNLLNSASQVHLPVAQETEEQELKKAEGSAESETHAEAESEPVVKNEPSSFVKDEPDSFVKTEPNSFVKAEADSFVKNEPNSFVLHQSDSQEDFFKTESDSIVFDKPDFAKKEPNSFVEPELVALSVPQSAVPESLIKTEPQLENQESSVKTEPDLSKQDILQTETQLEAEAEAEVETPNQSGTSQTEEDQNHLFTGKELGLGHDLKAEQAKKENFSFRSEDEAQNFVFTEQKTSETGYQSDASIQILNRDVAARSSWPVRLVTSASNQSGESHPGSQPDSSNDGDIDEEDASNLKVELEPIQHRLLEADSSNASDKFEDTTEDIQGRTLAPPKVDSNSPVDLVAVKHDEVVNRSDEVDSSILANSSNILPPFHLMHPSLANTSRNLDPYASFEESLSAEHDTEKKNTDYLSIWHSQLKASKAIPKSELTYKVPSILSYNTADLSQFKSYKIPVSLQKKKFTEVNVLSKRVVSPGFEDLQVSGFLPDISQNSALGDHFKSLMHSQTEYSTTSVGQQHGRSKSLGTTDVLTGIDDSIVEEPPAPTHQARHSIHGTLRPTSVTVNDVTPHTIRSKTTVRKSKFHVPSFEIKRSNSVLSPKNLYNDIFEESSFGRPTIKASGMKTLPSMDKNDVKRILQMKQALSHEEYSNLKLEGPQKRSVVQEPAAKYDNFQQLASIHCDSLMSTAPSNLQKKKPLSHVMDELKSAPVAIDSKDQIMNDLSIFQIKADNVVESPKSADALLGSLNRKRLDNLAFPEPDPDLISNSEFSPASPNRVASSSTVKIDETSKSPPPLKLQEPISLNVLPKKIHIVSVKGKVALPVEKLPTRSPIKINSSPVKLVKRGDSVTGVVLESTPNMAKFEGGELTNDKIRSPVQKSHENDANLMKKELSNVTEHPPREVSDKVGLGIPVASDGQAVAPSRAVSTSRTVSDSKSTAASLDSYRGKLFLRVVGLKNIELPDVKSRKCSFSLTLDNGVHCIKTPSYKIDSLNVLIGKEFELTVGQSLEFILTMKATYDKPKGTLVEVHERKVVKSKNRIGRLFGSKDIITTTKYVPQDVVDPWKTKFAADGSFARCYFDFEQYELQVTGIARNFNITCFNEWATASHGGKLEPLQPYQIAQLEVKMLFVPRTELYEVLPTSIKSAYESLDELRDESHLKCEGYMHQDGGDCETWKRRWFVLSGTSLVAHSEFSRKSRAKINLAKVVEVIYVDKENVNRLSSNYRNFSDILLMENAFKIRFANGEIIDFGAPNKEEKLQWIKVIQEIVYRNKFRQQPWIQTMQAKNGNSRPRSIVME